MDRTEKVLHWLDGTPYGKKISSSYDDDENDDGFFLTSSDGSERSRRNMMPNWEEETYTVDSESTVSSFSEDSIETFLAGHNDVFSSIFHEENDSRLQINPIGKQDKKSQQNGVVISKTILGLQVEQVKWSTLNNDLLLKVENILIPVHRNLLSAHSDHVRSKLKKRSDDLILTVRGKLHHVKAILEMVYGCGWNIDKDNVDELIKICEQLKIKQILDECKNYKKMTSNLSGGERNRKLTRTKSLKNLLGF